MRAELAALALVERELRTLVNSQPEHVAVEELSRVLNICAAQAEMIELGIHDAQMAEAA